MIRPLARGDLPAAKAIIDSTGLFPSDLLDGMTEGFLTGSDREQIWLVDDDGAAPRAIAFYAPEKLTEGTYNLYLIAVHAGQQGAGHGAALMRHIEQTLAADGQRLLLVETSGLPAFARTRNFYAANGYEQEARIRDFYQAGEDKIVFRKSLSQSPPQIGTS